LNKIQTILPIILGPTACGKTQLAVQVANKLHFEIISADSRQVYQGMDIGTGKDLKEYVIENKHIPHHLIDIVKAGYAYNLYEFQCDFRKVYFELQQQNKKALVCGGTGLYLESLIKNYNLQEVPEDGYFRKECENRSDEDLISELSALKKLHNSSDVDSRERLVRALEIARYEHKYGSNSGDKSLEYKPCVIGINVSRETRRERILSRLLARIEEGLLPEVEKLLSIGVTHEQLMYYGLEYKFASLFLQGEINKAEFIEKLSIAIFQFAKRQMTWFRGMEKRGIPIIWINGEQELECRVEDAISIIQNFK